MRIAVLLMMASTVFAASKIQVHGHRGARAAMPENSLPAFKYALAQGVDALELDLAVTSDNVLVVSHDATMNPKICTGPEGSPTVIRQMTLAQLRQWDCGSKQNPEFAKQQTIPGTRVPTFDEVLLLAKGAKVDLNVETKISPAKPELTPSPEEFVQLILTAVRKHGVESRLILQSFDWRTLAAMKKAAPAVRLSALYPTSANDLGKDFISQAKAAGYGIVSPHFRMASKAEIARAHAAGLVVVPWTANDVATWDALIDGGADAIITDDPAGLIAHLKQKGLR